VLRLPLLQDVRFLVDHGGLTLTKEHLTRGQLLDGFLADVYLLLQLVHHVVVVFQLCVEGRHCMLIPVVFFSQVVCELAQLGDNFFFLHEMVGREELSKNSLGYSVSHWVRSITLDKVESD